MKALINITLNGQQADYRCEMADNVDNVTVKRTCIEAIRAGETNLPTEIDDDTFDNFVIDSFHGGDHECDLRFVVRPKVPFG